jgi:hypothetical protein
MTTNFLGKYAAILMMGVGLAGCVNADVEVAFVDSTSAHVMTTTTIGADFYGMIKTAEAEAAEGSEETLEMTSGGFCDTGDLTENDDGSATCVDMLHGTFDELNAANEEEGGIVFTAQDDGTVRVSLPMDALGSQIGAEDEMDEETKTMMAAVFANHGITFTITAAEIIESNMDVSDDKSAATLKLDFADLIEGKTEFPEEYFALVRTP